MDSLPEHKDPYVDSILRAKHAELMALMAAIAADAPDIDLKIASIVEGESEEVTRSIVEHVRDMVRTREQEEARQQGLAMSAEEKRAIETERRSLRQWLMWLMSETTLKKIRLAALIPLLQKQGVKDIGAELAEKGVTLSLSETNKRELGQIAQALVQAKEKGAGRGRGL